MGYERTGRARNLAMTHGRHIKVLGKGPADRLRNVNLIKTMLENLVDTLDMRCLGSPHLYEVEEEIAKLNVEPFEDEGGVTGVVVLSTSHCAIHTWPLRSFFIMDVFSCRDFDASLIEPFLENYLSVSHIKMTDLSYSLIPDPMWDAENESERCTLN
jgi:S-adenosylmethionine/arginine decarboxylase-like enzyme